MRFASVLTIWVLLCISINAQAQHVQYGNLRGVIMDSSSHTPLESATVSVFLSSDTSLVGYCLTNRKGEFLVKDIPQGRPCRFTVTYKGLQTVLRNFILQQGQKELVTDTITLGTAFAELEGITIVAQKSPVIVKDDTTDFNASAFKTMPNAVVEDLLKQMPGFDIDKDGSITFNGKKVSKIMVDGKDFFGGDPIVALKNLPREIVEKIQLVDNKTKEQLLTKVTDGNEDKALNIVLQKDKKKGWFGRGMGAYGSQDRYEAGTSLNYFNKSMQVNVIGTANNTNRMNFGGGNTGLASGAGSGGITESRSVGANFGNEWHKKLKLSGSYFYGYNKNTTNVNSQRQNLLADSSFFYNTLNGSTNSNNSHRFSLAADYNIDTLTNITVNSSFSINDGNNQSSTDGISKGSSGKLINTSNNTNAGNSNNNSGTADIFFGRRLKKRGRSFSLGLNFNYNNQSGTNDNKARNAFYDDTTGETVENINQRNFTKGNGNNVAVTATYTEPVSKYLQLTLRYNYRTGTTTSDKRTYNFNPATNSYDLEDTTYTNAFRNTTFGHNPSVNFTYNKNKLRAGIGAGMQWLTQNNYSITKDNLLHQYNINFTPSANIGYRFSKTGNLNLYYTGRTQQPSVQQLQPVPDNSNTLYIRLGNPDLKQSFFHNVSLSMQKSDGYAYWNASVNGNTTMNQIVNESYYDTSGKQVSRPININGNYGLSGNVNYSKTWRKKNWSLRANLGTAFNYSNSVGITNKIQNTTKSYTLGQSIGITYTLQEKLIITPSFNIRYNNASYSVTQSQSPEYVTQAASLVVTGNIKKRLLLESNVSYNYNSRTAPGMPNAVTIWNAAAGYMFFSKKQGTLKFTIYDLLKQNAGVSRTISQNYIEDRQTQVLQRYFLVSFIYNFRKFG